MKKIILTRTLSVMRYLAQSVLPIIFWCSLLFGFDSPDIAILTVLSALIHELGHITVIILTKREAKLDAHVSGFRIRTSSASYRDEILQLLGGPFSNILFFLVTIPFFNALEGYIALFGIVNLLTGLSNLVPIEGYDGYGIIKRLLLINNLDIGERVLSAFSFSLSVILTFLSLYLLYRFGEGYWVFGVFIVLLLNKIKKLLPRSE
ncbi:MAG: hypothetical protein IKC87_07195 [Clostridia bacterium]|nr:hypothetical protein [Clostridia bacterium]